MAAEGSEQVPQQCLTVRVGWQKKLTKRDIPLNLTSDELQAIMACIQGEPRQPALIPCSDETIPAVLECLLATLGSTLSGDAALQYWPNRGACYFIVPAGAGSAAVADALVAAHGAPIPLAGGRLFSARLHEGLKETSPRAKPPSVTSTYTPPIAGLRIIRDFLPAAQEASLLESISATRAGNSGVLSRRVVHYGYAFDYARRAVDWGAAPLPIPADIAAVAEALLERGALPAGTVLDQSTVNDYAPGQGIAGHLDNPKVFGPVVISVSMGAPIVMNFERPPASDMQACPPLDPPSPEEAALPDCVSVLLPPRSALVLTGRARYAWAHGITKRKTDVIDDKVVSRRNRTSLTFRQVIETPDKPVDDTPAVLLSAALQEAHAQTAAPAAAPPQLPPFDGPSAMFEVNVAAAASATSSAAASHSAAAPSEAGTDPGTTGPDVERSNVHKLYNAIARHFSGTRHSPWPSVAKFLNTLPERSLVFDLGCGNGKYMVGHITDPPNRVSVIGADISSGLTEICGQRGLNVLTADALCVPFRSGAADASISIAVLHHLSSPKRRHAAIAELLRVVRPGGRFMVQAWAQEQDEAAKRRFEAQDVMVPWKFRPEYLSAAPAYPGGPRPEHSLASDAAAGAGAGGAGAVDAEAAAAAEVARVAAAWGGEVDADGGRVVFQRYCHVYVAGELRGLVEAHPQARVDAAWWERGNWCVTGTKAAE